jgi:hypothetical protein
MMQRKMVGRILQTVTLIALLHGLTGCCLFQSQSVVILPESKVQKISSGESANFDGFVVTGGALSKMLEAAERCQVKK